jgi:hypothetical protein
MIVRYSSVECKVKKSSRTFHSDSESVSYQHNFSKLQPALLSQNKTDFIINFYDNSGCLQWATHELFAKSVAHCGQWKLFTVAFCP